MNINIIIFLITTIVVTLIFNSRNIHILVRISSIVLIYAGVLLISTFYIQPIGSGIGIYSGLFQAINQFMEVLALDLDLIFRLVITFFKDMIISVSFYLKNLEYILIHKNYINFNFDFSGYTAEQVAGIGLFLFGQVIMGSTISIALTIYGEYLIQKFDLESKYPKISKFIKLRIKFQNYYLIIDILLITLILIAMIFINLLYLN